MCVCIIPLFLIESKIMNARRFMLTQLTPWEDRDSLSNDLVSKTFYYPHSRKQTHTDNRPQFPQIPPPGFTPSSKHKGILSLHNKWIPKGSNQSRNPCLGNTKMLFPMKTSTVHIHNILELVPQKYKSTPKTNTSCDQILTLCNNSLIKVKILNRGRRGNKCKRSLVNLKEMGEVSREMGREMGRGRSINTSLVKSASQSEYKKASLLKIKAMLMR